MKERQIENQQGVDIHQHYENWPGEGLGKIIITQIKNHSPHILSPTIKVKIIGASLNISNRCMNIKWQTGQGVQFERMHQVFYLIETFVCNSSKIIIKYALSYS